MSITYACVGVCWVCVSPSCASVGIWELVLLELLLLLLLPWEVMEGLDRSFFGFFIPVEEEEEEEDAARGREPRVGRS